MSVLVVGASGAVGGLVVAGLLERGEQVRATSRDPRRLALPPHVGTFTADLDDPASFGPALEGVERVFLYADLHDPEALVAQLARAGVRHVVLLSSSAVTQPGAETDYNGSRFLRVERAIDAAGLDRTFLRPGGFAGNAARWSWGVRADSAVPLPYPEAVQAPVHEADIADVAVLALTGDTLPRPVPALPPAPANPSPSARRCTTHDTCEPATSAPGSQQPPGPQPRCDGCSARSATTWGRSGLHSTSSPTAPADGVRHVAQTRLHGQHPTVTGAAWTSGSRPSRTPA